MRWLFHFSLAVLSLLRAGSLEVSTFGNIDSGADSGFKEDGQSKGAPESCELMRQASECTTQGHFCWAFSASSLRGLNVNAIAKDRFEDIRRSCLREILHRGLDRSRPKRKKKTCETNSANNSRKSPTLRRETKLF